MRTVPATRHCRYDRENHESEQLTRSRKCQQHSLIACLIGRCPEGKACHILFASRECERRCSKRADRHERLQRRGAKFRGMMAVPSDTAQGIMLLSNHDNTKTLAHPVGWTWKTRTETFLPTTGALCQALDDDCTPSVVAVSWLAFADTQLRQQKGDCTGDARPRTQSSPRTQSARLRLRGQFHLALSGQRRHSATTTSSHHVQVGFIANSSTDECAQFAQSIQAEIKESWPLSHVHTIPIHAQSTCVARARCQVSTDTLPRVLSWIGFQHFTE
jgi:hypothetical protein